MHISLDGVQFKYKELVISLVTIAVAFGFYYFAIRPQQGHLAVLKERQWVEQQHVEAINQFVRSNPDTEKVLREVAAKLNRINQMLPDAADVGGLLLQLERAGLQSHIQLLQIVPGSAVKKGELLEIPLEITIRGDYFQILDFLQRLENDARFVKITNINIYVNEQQLEGKLGLAAYNYGAGEANAMSDRSGTVLATPHPQ